MSDAKERRRAAAALKQAQEAKARRNRMLMTGGGVLVIVIVLAGLVALGLRDNHGGATTATATVSKEVTHVPAATLDAIGQGIYTNSSLPNGMTANVPLAPQAITSTPMTQDGKPRILFVGAEWCPYCAAQRWVLAVALSRFGTFSNLGEVYSAADDGDLASLTFHGSTYTSKYLDFAPFEIEDRNHNTLDKLSASDNALFTNKDLGDGGFPFIDLGGYYKVGAMYDPEMISDLTQAQIAADLKNPKSSVAQAIDGSANVLTGYLCKLTKGQPGDVCNSAGVKAAAS